MISVSTVITLNRSARLSHDYILSNKDTISFMLKTRKYYSITVVVKNVPMTLFDLNGTIRPRSFQFQLLATALSR